MAVALLGAMTVDAAEDEKTPLYINVGKATTYNKENLTTLDSKYLDANNVLNVGSGDLVGYFKSDDDTLTADEFINSSFTTAGTQDAFDKGNITNSLKINGGLNITGSGQVYIAGKSGSNFYSRLDVNNVTISGTGNNKTVEGKETDDVQLCANLNLRADAANIGSLTMKGGAAILGPYESGGGDDIWSFGPDSDSSKSVSIGALTVDDGYLQLGRATNSENMAHTSKNFKTFLTGAIEQNGGTIVARGKIYLGTNSITQSGGTMELGKNSVNTERLVLGSTSLNITQKASEKSKGEPKLTISGAFSRNDSFLYYNQEDADGFCQISIDQQCKGEITFEKGVLFTSKDWNKIKASTISQSGGGTINLNGDFTSADFTITQTNGTINQNGTIDLYSENKIGGTLENNGTINATDENSMLKLIAGGCIENNGTIAMDIYMEDGELTATNESKFANITAEKGTITISGQVTIKGQLTLGNAPESSTFSANSTEGKVIVNLLGVNSGINLTDTDYLALGDDVVFNVMVDSFEDLNAIDTLTIFQDKTVNITQQITATDKNGNEKVVIYTDKGNGSVTVNAVVPEPTTATLSLLALAALASRRRRK